MILLKNFISTAFFLFIFCTAGLGQEKRFTILHTSDEHSNLLPLPLTEYQKDQPNPAIGGFARLADKVAQIREMKGKEPVVLLSSGDIMGGSPFAWLILRGMAAELEIMNKIGYAAFTIGNHEFDYGPKVLAEYLAKGGYTSSATPGMKIIASNLDIPKGHVLGNINMEPHSIIELENGLKLGILGILGASAYKLAPAAEEIGIRDQFKAAQENIDALKRKGADVIIMLSHSGIDEDRKMAKKLKGLDIILGGHDHIETTQPELVNGIIIAHPNYYVQKLGVLELSFENGKGVKLLNEANGTPFLQVLSSDITENTEIAALIATHQDSLNALVAQFSNNRFADVSASVIESPFPVVKQADLKETGIGNFVADAMRIVGTQITGERVDFAFQGNGVIRADIIPGQSPAVKNQFSLFDLVTVAGLGSGPDMQPGYPMVSVYLTAKEIFNALEVTAMLSQFIADNYFLQISGIQYTYDPGKAMWGRLPIINKPLPANKAVKSIALFKGDGYQTADGEYIHITPDSEGLYHIVTDYYLAKFLPVVKDYLPGLAIVFKDKNGNERTLDECIIMHEGREFKVWEAVAQYADDLKVMPEIYREPQGRIIEERGIPYYVWTLLALALLVFGIFALLRKLLLKKQ